MLLHVTVFGKGVCSEIGEKAGREHWAIGEGFLPWHRKTMDDATIFPLMRVIDEG
jgi:hypothetical protein